MKIVREAGILLHISSLPGQFGIGDIGPQAYRFVDFLKETGQKIWQILPITATDQSPYSGTSAFAGNPNLISPEKLVKEGLLLEDDLNDCPEFSNEKVDFSKVINFKHKLLRLAFKRFKKINNHTKVKEYEDFCNQNNYWLEDFSLFMGLRENFSYKSEPVWTEWPNDIVCRQPEAIADYKKELEPEINYQKFIQYLFFYQWYQLKSYTNKLGIKIIGDMPIYVSYDSADVWTCPELFQLDNNKKPVAVSGSPADQFSEIGQVWGNPLYNWDKLKENKFDWWVKRVRKALSTVDIVRIDHFRGFEAYWSIPESGKPSEGKWIKAPGEELLNTLKTELGELNLIAEDLGHITPEVMELRDKFAIPGMKVLQFAFKGDTSNPYLPFNYQNNFIAYTGTHDNDTTLSWFQSLSGEERMKVLEYLNSDGKEINWELIKLVHSSVADFAVIPLQDLLGTGEDGRMNNPAGSKDNWAWRFKEEEINQEIKDRLYRITKIYGR
jgi:4-alpha-glucanotransferase